MDSDDDDDAPISPEELDALHAEAAMKWLRQVEETIAEVDRENAETGFTGPYLFTADALRAAGAFDFPPGWRKSLSAGNEQRDLFSGLIDDEPADEDEAPSPEDADS